MLTQLFKPKCGDFTVRSHDLELLRKILLVCNQYVSYRGQQHTIRHKNMKLFPKNIWGPKFCLWPINGHAKRAGSILLWHL